MMTEIEGVEPEPKDFCAVCEAPFCTSRTLVGGEFLWSCSDECAEMLQGWQRVCPSPNDRNQPRPGA